MDWEKLQQLQLDIGALESDAALDFIGQLLEKQREVLRLRREVSLDSTSVNLALRQRVQQALASPAHAPIPSGDAILLAGWILHLGGADSFNARQINCTLSEAGVSVSNITSAIESVVRRRHFLIVDGEQLGKHKTYQMSSEGLSAAPRLHQRLDLANEDSSDMAIGKYPKLVPWRSATTPA